MLKLEKKIAEFIQTERLFAPRDKILVTLSGGADSVAMLYVLRALQKERFTKTELICVHINHHLRGAESEEDEDFVIRLTESVGVPMIVDPIDVQSQARREKLSIETAARQLRLDRFMQIAKNTCCRFIATGHHKNDNAETVIHRLLRGTGPMGLAGIRPKKQFAAGLIFVRPMLCATRDEIISYLNEINVRWREDRSNADITLTRNFIRHRLIPEIQKNSESCITDLVAELSAAARGLIETVTCTADHLSDLQVQKPDAMELFTEGFSKQHTEVQIELIRRALYHIGCGLGDISRRTYLKIIRLATSQQSGKQLELPGGFAVEKSYDRLVFSSAKKPSLNPNETVSVELNMSGETTVGDVLFEIKIFDSGRVGSENNRFTANNTVEYFDLDTLKLPLTVRHRRKGDMFMPLGLEKEKKIGKFLTDQRIPRNRRDNLVIEDREKIIWLWPLRMSEQTKITDRTKKILQIKTSTDKPEPLTF